MKTILIEQPGKIRISETAMPKLKEGEALLKIRYCGICGADVASCTDNQTMGVQRDGSFCEYVAMPIERIIPGQGLSAQELALIEPFSIGYHALSRAHIEPTDKILIVGAGPIGLFALISAKLRGATVYVSDMLAGRLETALEYGADGVIDVSKQNLMEAVNKITGGKGFDICVEACGLSTTFLNCIDTAAFAGTIILIGNGKKETSFLHSVLLKKELNVYGSRNAYTKDFKALIQLVAAGKVDVLKMVSAVYPLERASEAFEALVHNDGSLKKVLIEISK